MLQSHPLVRSAPGPLVLLVLDGVGVGHGDQFDAVASAVAPTLHSLAKQGLFRTLKAHGKAVGLPSDADMGNSEVGHNILGAGRIVPQGASLVESAMASGVIWSGVWEDMLVHLRSGSGATFHLIGLLSDGGVHSHEDHLHAILRRAAQERLPRVRVHVLLDGRDVSPQSALDYVDRLEALLAECRAGGLDYRIASGGGRMVITMDRYGADWGMVERGWNTHVHGIGPRFPSARAAIERYREESPTIGDQFLEAFVVSGPDDVPVGRIVDGDAVLLFNFRGDRALELSEAFDGDESFAHFDRGRRPDVFFAGMMLYDGDRNLPRRYLIAAPRITGSVSELLAECRVPQFAAAETQKFGHITYFWNGNRSGKFDPAWEEYVEIPSDSGPFDAAPAMKSAETADVVIAAIESGNYRFIRANFAGGDMVGHTGSIPATVHAIEAIDEAIGRIVRVVNERGCDLIITADHGNAEEMVELDAAGAPVTGPGGALIPRTSHTLNPVPFWLLRRGGALGLRRDLPEAGLANVGATVIELLGYQAPKEFEPSLLLLES